MQLKRHEGSKLLSANGNSNKMEKYMGRKNGREHLRCQDQRPDHCHCLQARGEVEPSGLWRPGGNLCSLLEKEIIAQQLPSATLLEEVEVKL